MKKSLFLSTLLMSLTLSLAACNDDSDDNSEDTANDSNNNTEESTSEESSSEEATSSSDESSSSEGSGDLSGTIVGDGSSTVFPILEVINEDFNAEHGVAAEIGVSGTGAGFDRFVAGETDFQNASRDIRDEEVEALEDAGIEFTEFLVATDGLTVAVNQDNDFVESLTYDELVTIFSGEASSWSDVNSDFPDEPIQVYAPDESHGTHDYFVEEVMDDEDVVAETIQDTNQVVSSVTADSGAIGFFGYNFYLENQDSLKVVSIQGPDNDSAVEPTNEAVMSYEYPLARPLYVYVKNESLENNEAVFAFVEYLLNNSQNAAEEVGYVGLEDDALQEEQDKLEAFNN